MEKNRSVSLQIDGKSKKKIKNKKNKEQNGSTNPGETGEGSSGAKEKCHVM